MMDNCEFVPSIAAENAALKMKIKQEYDKACAIVNELHAFSSKIDICERENKQYDEIFEFRNSELIKCEEELENIYLSKERVQSNIENLKKQYELMLIDEQQREKERSSVRLNYEMMIRNQKEIYNSHPSVMKKTRLQDKLQASAIHLVILRERVENLKSKKCQLKKIQELKLRNSIIKLAKIYMEVQRQNVEKKSLVLQIKEKKISLEKLKEQEEKKNSEMKKEEIVYETSKNDTKLVYSPNSFLVSNGNGSVKSAASVPSIKEMQENHLLNYFQQLKSFRITHTPCVLPPLLSRSLSPSMKNFSSEIYNSKSYVERQINLMSNSAKETSKTDVDLSDKNTENNEGKLDDPKHENSNNEKTTAENTSSVTEVLIQMDELQKSADSNNTTSSDTTNQIHNMDFSNHVDDMTSLANSLSVDTKSNSERVQKDVTGTPKSRIPVFTGRSPFRNNVSRIPVRCSPSPKAITSPQLAQNLGNSKVVHILESPTKISKENIFRFNKRMDLNHSKLTEKQSKVDSAHLQRTEMQKLKRKPSYVEDFQHNITNVNSYQPNVSKHLPYIIETNTKLNKFASRARGNLSKSNTNVRINEGKAIAGHQKIQKFLDLVEMQFPDDVKNLRNAIHSNPNFIRKKYSVERFRKNSVEELTKNKRFFSPEQNTNELSEVMQYEEVPPRNLVEGMEILNQDRQPQSSDTGTDGEIQEQKEPGQNENSDVAESGQNQKEVKKIDITDDEKRIPNERKNETYSGNADEMNHSKYFESGKVLRKKSGLNATFVHQPYFENYQSNNENMFAVSDGGTYELDSVDLNYDQLYPDTFSPTSDTFSAATPDVHPFSMLPFASLSTNGSAFGFGSSMNQIFGSNESTPNNSRQGGNFSFHFTEQTDNQQPFRFY